MGLWNTGITRSKTGQLRKEQDIADLLPALNQFLDGFSESYKTIHPFDITYTDNMIYIRCGQYGVHFSLEVKSHYQMMHNFMHELNRYLIYTKGVNMFHVLRDTLHRNITMFIQTQKLSDLFNPTKCEKLKWDFGTKV